MVIHIFKDKLGFFFQLDHAGKNITTKVDKM